MKKELSALNRTHDQPMHQSALRRGAHDAVPIAMGYFAVAFTLGIVARKAGLTPVQGFVASLLNNASAGEYAGFMLIAAQASYWETALVTLITNARYLLMSCALSQKFSPDTPMIHRFLVGYDLSDELFGLAEAQPGYLNPYYSYGAILLAMPCWAAGTALGIAAGEVMPANIVSAFSVALYGMFLAIIIPPAKKNRIIAGVVAVSFAASYGASVLPLFAGLSEGTRTILLTLAIAGGAAALFPFHGEVKQ